MHTVKNVKALEDFKLLLTFENRKKKIIDLKKKLKKGIFEELRNPDYFKKVEVNNDIGTICWPNGADFCPDVLFEQSEEI